MEERIEVKCSLGTCAAPFEADTEYVLEKTGLVFCEKHKSEGFVDGSYEGLNFSEREVQEWELFQRLITASLRKE